MTAIRPGRARRCRRDSPARAGRAGRPARETSAGSADAKRSAALQRHVEQADAVAHRLAMSSADPPACRPRRAAAVATLISSPYSAKLACVPPTGGMASVTSIGCARAAQRQPQHGRIDMHAVDDHAVPGIRSSRAPPRSARARGCRAARMALNRWVKPGQPFGQGARWSARRSPWNGRAQRARRPPRAAR